MGSLLVSLLVMSFGLGAVVQLAHELLWNSGWKHLKYLDFKPVNCPKCLAAWVALLAAPLVTVTTFIAPLAVGAYATVSLTVLVTLAVMGFSALGAVVAQNLQNSSSQAYLAGQLHRDVLGERLAQREAALKAKAEAEEAASKPKPRRKSRTSTTKK